MNATPSINLNATNAVQPAASGKSQNASTESPFKQVLSSETNRRSEHTAREKRETKTEATESVVAKPTEQDVTASDVQTDTPASTATETLLALAIPADALKAQPAGDGIGLALALGQPAGGSNGLALAPGQISSTNMDTDGEAGDQALKLALTLDTASAGHKGRATEPQVSRPDEAKDPKSDTVPSGKTRLQAAIQAATAQAPSSSSATTAAAFAGQLAAARQADALKSKDLPTELLGAAPLRASAQTELPMPSVDPLASSKLTPSVGTTAWSQALGEKVVWMAAGAQKTATLTLNPPNMGPLQIVLSLTNDQASASFFSAQPEVRQALEAAFPKLREMMNEAGIQLGQASVSAESPRQNDASDRQAQRSTALFNVSDDGVSIGQGLPLTATTHSGRGLIDTFA